MATKYGNWLWEGLSTETKPTTSEMAGDGHIFKELDTGDTYERQAGVWINLSIGTSYIRATKSGSITTDGSGIYNVVFVTNFKDTNYTIQLCCAEDGTTQPARAGFSLLTTSGFRITTRYTRTGNIKPSVTVSWLATRNYNP